MASSMSNSFALLGADNGFKQVPSKKNRKKKNKAQDQTPADESSVTLSSNPSEMSEDAAGVASESFQQVKATAKSKKQQQGIDTDIIKQEDEAASRAHSQDALQNLFTRWEHSMEQVNAGAPDSSDRSRVGFREALVQSKAVETALSQIMSLPEPLAMEQRLATFLEALMHGQANRPAKLASAVVGIAAAAKKDGSQEFGKDAQHALHTVGLTLRHMVTQSAASQASKDRSEDDAHLAQQCSSKEAALEKAQTAEEKLQLAMDLHTLSVKRLELSGPSSPSILKPMQQVAVWQDKLQQHLQEATMSREARKTTLTQEEADLSSEAASLEKQLEELQRKVKEINKQLQANASRRKHIADALSGRGPDHAKSAEQMQDDLKAAAHLKAVLVEMTSSGTTAAAPEQATQPSGAYTDALITLLTCTKTSALELLERGRQTARHVKNAQQAVQQVESMSAREQREKLRPSALAALEGRERELKGIRKAAESLAASTDKATGGFNSRKQDPSMPSDKAVQVTDLLNSVRTVFREIAAGPEPAPEPQKSEKTGGKREKRSAPQGKSHAASASASEKASVPRPEPKIASPAPPRRESRPAQNQKLTAAEARKQAGFAVTEKEEPAWMRKAGGNVPARSQPQHVGNGRTAQASKPVTPQKPVSYAKLLNGHAAQPSSGHADTDAATEEESILDAVTTSEKSTPPKDNQKTCKHVQEDKEEATEAAGGGAETQPVDSETLAV